MFAHGTNVFYSGKKLKQLLDVVEKEMKLPKRFQRVWWYVLWESFLMVIIINCDGNSYNYTKLYWNTVEN